MTQLTLLAVLTLPYPPSVNHYTKRNRNGSVRLSDKARAYKVVVRQQTADKRPHTPSEARLAGEFVIHPPNRRKFDLDNKMKLILDSLEDAGFYANDEQFDEIVIKRGDPMADGKVVATICEMTKG